MTGPLRPPACVRIGLFVLPCFGVIASAEVSLAASLQKSESPSALLVEARDTAASIEDRAERSAAFDRIILAQIATDPPTARETVRRVPRLPNKLTYLRALAEAYARIGNVAETERLYAEIVVEQQPSEAGKLAIADALGQVAIAHAKKGNLEEAFATLNRLKERTNQTPPAIVGTATATLAEAQANSGDVDGAVQTALTIAGDNPFPLMGIVAGRVRNGKEEQAQDIVSRLDDGLQRYAQWGVMRGQMEQRRLIDAQVTASAIKPGHAKASAFLELATYHRKRGGKPLALTLLHEADESARATINDRTRADILWQIAAETARAGDADRAVVIAKSIENASDRNRALSEIVEAQAKLGEFGGAFNTASLLEDPGETERFTSPRYDSAVSTILGEMVKHGKAEEAKDTAARLEQTTIRRVSLYAAIARAYADIGKINEAHQALALADTERQRRARRNELRQLAEKAPLAAADEMRLQGLRKIDHDVQPGLEAIARALARQGNIKGGMSVADGVAEPAARLRLMTDLSRLHVQAGHKADTLRWARALVNPSEKVAAFVGIATAFSDDTEKRKPKPRSEQKTKAPTERGTSFCAYLPKAFLSSGSISPLAAMGSRMSVSP